MIVQRNQSNIYYIMHFIYNFLKLAICITLSHNFEIVTTMAKWHLSMFVYDLMTGTHKKRGCFIKNTKRVGGGES